MTQDGRKPPMSTRYVSHHADQIHGQFAAHIRVSPLNESCPTDDICEASMANLRQKRAKTNCWSQSTSYLAYGMEHMQTRCQNKIVSVNNIVSASAIEHVQTRETNMAPVNQ